MSYPRIVFVAAAAFLLPGLTRAAEQAAPAATTSRTARAATAPPEVVQELSALLDSGQLAPAKARVDRALHQYPADAALHNIAGAIAAQQGDYRLAERHFRAAISANARSSAAYLNLGRLYQEHSKEDAAAMSKARAVYRRLIEIDPRHAEALFQAAYLAAQAGEWKQSRQLIDRLLALEDARTVGSSESLRDLGLLYADAEQLEGARALLEASIAAAGTPSVPMLLDLARIAYKQKDFQRALGYLAHARDLNPKAPEVHFFFGITCVELNLGSEAYDALKQAVALAPENAYVNYAMGAVALHRRDPSEALPFFEKYLRLKPDDPRGRFVMGAARFYSNDFDGARVDLEQATRSPETAAGAHYFLARIARQLNDLDAARQEVERALQIKPVYPDALAELGLLQTRQANYDAAEQSLAKALSIDSENYFANFNLAALYARTKDPRRQAQEARVEELQQKRAIAAQEFLRLIEVVK